MGSYEIERNFFIGLAGAVVFCLFGAIIGGLAKRKGYSFLAWFGTGGTLLVSAILLAFRPKLRGVEMSDEQRAMHVRRGNLIGWILSIINGGLVVLAADIPLILNFGQPNYEDYFQRSFFPALHWIEWVYYIGMAIMLLRFICMPRGSRHPLLFFVLTAITIQFVWSYAVDAIQHSDPGDSWKKICLIGRTVFSFLGILVTLVLCYLVTEPRSAAKE